MAAQERRQYGACKDLIAEFMSDGEWHGGAEVCQGVSCASSTATYHLHAGAECGQYETRPSTKGGHQYRLRQDAAAQAAEAACEDAHTDTDMLEGFHWTCLKCGKHYSGPQHVGWTVRFLGDSHLDYGCISCRDGADATSSEDEEDAKTVPASPPAPAAPVIPPPEQPADVAPASEPLPPQARLAPFAGIVTTTQVGYSMSRELRILSDLEDLDEATRERVLGYAFARWPGKLDIVREVEVRYPSADKLMTEILDTLDRHARTVP